MNCKILKKVTLLSYFLLLFSGTLIPSDAKHGLFNPKSLLFVLTLLSCFAYFLVRNKLNRRQVQLLAFFFSACTFLGVFFFVGHERGYSNFSTQIDHLKLFVITYTFVFVSLLYYEEGLLKWPQFMKVFLWGNLLYMVAKLLIVALFALKVITLEELIQWTGIQVMSMEVSDQFERFQTSMDLATPFLFYFLLNAEAFSLRVTTRFKLIYLFVGVVSLVLSFSRVFFFVGFTSVLFFMVLKDFNRLVKGTLVVLVAFVTFVMVMGVGNVEKMIEARLFSQENSESDIVREAQINALMRPIHEKPVLGMGVGGYVSEVIRSEENRHSYEVQWVALIAQLGFLGVLFLWVPLCAILLLFLAPPFNAVKLLTAILFMGWIASGFTNPFVISLTSGIMYSLFAIAGLECRKKYGLLARKSHPGTI